MKITNPCATINYFLTAVPTKNEIDSINHIITRYDSLGFAGDLTVEKKKTGVCLVRSGLFQCRINIIVYIFTRNVQDDLIYNVSSLQNGVLLFIECHERKTSLSTFLRIVKHFIPLLSVEEVTNN